MIKLHEDKDLLYVFNHHVKLVVEIGLELCDEFNGNKKIVEPSCWLHDIASLTAGNKYKHHINGANMAEKILTLLDYQNNDIDNVKYCIQSHRGSYPLQRITKEAEIVCSADGIANLKYGPLLYYFAFGVKQLKFEDGIKKINSKIESSWKKIADYAKPKAQEDYVKWRSLFI